MSTYNESDHARSSDGRWAPTSTSETDTSVLDGPLSDQQERELADSVVAGMGDGVTQAQARFTQSRMTRGESKDQASAAWSAAMSDALARNRDLVRNPPADVPRVVTGVKYDQAAGMDQRTANTAIRRDLEARRAGTGVPRDAKIAVTGQCEVNVTNVPTSWMYETDNGHLVRSQAAMDTIGKLTDAGSDYCKVTRDDQGQMSMVEGYQPRVRLLDRHDEYTRAWQTERIADHNSMRRTGQHTQVRPAPMDRDAWEHQVATTGDDSPA